eukprot:7313812-Pyramimonas_sp.AAC.1
MMTHGLGILRVSHGRGIWFTATSEATRTPSLWCTTSATLKVRILAVRLLGTYPEVQDIDPVCIPGRFTGTYRELWGHSFSGGTC